jgi:hypothetical protein
MSLNIIHCSFIFFKSSVKPVVEMALEYYARKLIKEKIEEYTYTPHKLHTCSISYVDEDYILCEDTGN